MTPEEILAGMILVPVLVNPIEMLTFSNERLGAIFREKILAPAKLILDANRVVEAVYPNQSGDPQP